MQCQANKNLSNQFNFREVVLGTTNPILKLVSSIVYGKYWKVKLMFYAIFLALFVSPPSTNNLRFGDNESYWPTVENQVSHPFRPIKAHPKSHAANKSFRLTVPLLAKALNLDRKGIYILQSFSIFIMIWIVLNLAFRITSSRSLTALFLTAITPLYPIVCAYQETTGHLDAFAYCFILLAMNARTPLLIFSLCTCAAWCDERAFIATSLVFIWWYIQKPNLLVDGSGTSLVPNSNALAVLFSCFLYVVTRGLLMEFTSLRIAMENPDLTILPQYLNLIPLLSFLAFGGLWILPIICLCILLIKRNYLFILVNIIPFIVIFFVSSIVWDFTRSISFLLPLFFTSLFLLVRVISLQKIKYILAFTAIFSIVMPCFYFDSQLNYLPGVPFKIAEFIVNRLYLLVTTL